jgi:RimJ/RimL family protein N-acetyltransferase
MVMKDLTRIGELPLLCGDAITLRPWRADDAAAVAAACDDEDVARWMPLMPHPYTLADGEEWVGDAARKWLEERWANFAAEDAATGTLVGSCGLRIETQHERGEIGYLVHRDHRGRGVATACVAVLSDWAFDELGLGRIEIRADVRNVASMPRMTTSKPASKASRACRSARWEASWRCSSWASPSCCRWMSARDS